MARVEGWSSLAEIIEDAGGIDGWLEERRITGTAGTEIYNMREYLRRIERSGIFTLTEYNEGVLILKAISEAVYGIVYAMRPSKPGIGSIENEIKQSGG